VAATERELLPAFAGVRTLGRRVRAVTTNCGFLAKFQSEVAASVSSTVFTSGLILVPLVHRMLPPKAVSIMTVDASSLRPEHYGRGHHQDIPTVVAGMRRGRSSRG
jgi:hypothetical protein